MIGFLIVACEIGFWVFVLAGLIARYQFKQERLSMMLFFCTVLIDFFLLIFTFFDLKNGAVADFFHGLSAVYIGVSIAFGRQMINWADRQYQYRFAGGEKPVKREKFGKERAKEERQGWYRHLFSWIIGASLLTFLILYFQNVEQTAALSQILSGWTVVLTIDFFISFSYTLFPKKG